MLHTLFFERLEGNPSKKENIPIIMLDVGCVVLQQEIWIENVELNILWKYNPRIKEPGAFSSLVKL